MIWRINVSFSVYLKQGGILVGILCLTFALILPLGGYSQDSGAFQREKVERSNRYVERGEELQKVGDHRGALMDYDEAIRIYPENAGAYVARGRLKVENENVDGGFMDYTEAIEIDPEYDPAYYERSRALKKKEDWEGALSDLSQAIELNSSNGDYYEQRADLRMNRHLYAEAAEDYERLANIQKDSAIPLGHAGGAKLYDGDFDGALETLNKALKRNRHYSGAYLVRANLKVLKGLYKSALVDYGKSIRMDNRNAGGFLSRGLFYFAQGEIEKARKDIAAGLQWATEEESVDYANLWLFLIDRQSGKEASATEKLRLYFEDRPVEKEGDWYETLANFLIQKIPERELFDSAVDSDSIIKIEQMCEAYFYAAQLNLLNRKYSEAVELLKDCLESQIIRFYEYQAATVQLRRLENSP